MLTSNDDLVLTHLFDPEASPSAPLLIDPSLSADPNITDPSILTEIYLTKKSIIQNIEIALRQPPSDQPPLLESAQTDLQSLIILHPNSASLLNDYVQLLRLRYGDTLLISCPTIITSSTTSTANKPFPHLPSQALTYLTHGISLLTPPSPQSPLSPSQARTLGQLHTQRGALLHGASKALAADSNARVMTEVKRQVGGWTAVDFAEAASRDFWLGGRYGNEVARGLAVHANPTARLCGEIVRGAMRREIGGEVGS